MKFKRRKMCVILMCTLIMSIFCSAVPATAVSNETLTLSKNFLMVQVGNGYTPLTASLPNVSWSSSDNSIAQYNTTYQGVISPMNGGYASVTATVGNQSASCEVCSYYGNTISNGTYFIQSTTSKRFLTASNSVIQSNIDSGLQRWTITATDDGYFTLRVVNKFAYLGCDTSSGTPTLTQIYTSSNDNAKWIIKAINSDSEGTLTYIIMPKNLASEGYMLAVNSAYNVNGGELTLKKWDADTNSLCGWYLHNTNNYKPSLSSWNTALSTVSYHSGDIKMYTFFYVDSSETNYTIFQSNFNSGYTTAAGQWSEKLNVSITLDSLGSGTDVINYGVTRDSYQLLTGKTWSAGVSGYTTNSSSQYVYKGYTFVANTNKKIDIYETTQLVSVYILMNTNESLIQAVFSHEMGHALGFIDHSTSPSHLMYPYLRRQAGSTSLYNFTLTDDESHDLGLIYDRYN